MQIRKTQVSAGLGLVRQRRPSRLIRRALADAKARYLQADADAYAAKVDATLATPQSFGHSLIPIVGSRQEAINDFAAGHYVTGTIATVGAVTDVLLVKSLATAAAKAVAGGVGKIAGVIAEKEAVVVTAEKAAPEAIGETIRCFVGGTPVLLGDGRTTVPIEDLYVGRRVATDGGVANSADGKTGAVDPNATEVDPKTWRLVTIMAGDVEVRTLQPVSWIAGHGVMSGTRIDLSQVVDLREMGMPAGVYGTVEAVEACPTIENGPGRVVLTTATDLSSDVFDLTLTDAAETTDVIGVTGGHRFYTEDRGWVRAEDLMEGETVRGDHGALTVTGLARHPGTARVYNMTVEGNHVYYVGDLSALVHNTYTLGQATPEMLDKIAAVHDELDIIAASRRTTAIVRGVNGSGEILDVVASSERALTASQRAAATALNLQAATGLGHAEMKALQFLQLYGFRPTAVAASREICDQCISILKVALD